jgi:hypothetical protein
MRVTGTNGEGVYLTRRRGDAEEEAESTQESQDLRTQRKRRDVGWRRRIWTHVGGYFEVRPNLSAQAREDGQDQPSTAAYASLRSSWISAHSATPGFDFLNRLLRVFLRVSASPRQTYSRFYCGFALEAGP